MKDLKCGLKNCKYNKGYCCCAKAIAVDNHTECVTYELDNTKRKTMFEAGTDFIPANYNVDTKISCSAKCLFNRDNECIANGITVIGEPHREASYLTFVKK
jgi:hypothetical protein